MIPRVALGTGFFGSMRPKASDAHVYPVNVSNGMPVVVQKKPILEKGRGLKSPKTRSRLGKKK
jgi:hypothetical protein